MILKVPQNIAGICYKDLRLYCRFLDLKAQAPDLGTFRIYHTKRGYQRDIKKMISKGWIERKGKTIYLRAYQHVWRLLGIERMGEKIRRFRYWKINTDRFSLERKNYLREIETEIRKRIAKRKQAQIRFALNKQDGVKDRATFTAKRASLLFGYRSATTGTKLREKFFCVLPQSEEEKRPYWNSINGRYENRPKQIAV